MNLFAILVQYKQRQVVKGGPSDDVRCNSLTWVTTTWVVIT